MNSRNNIFYKYSYLWITLAFFLLSALGHWVFAWRSYVHEQEAHAQPTKLTEFFDLTLRDTFENWQSEFLQLMWQVGGLALLLYVGSPQSKEGDERVEAELDLILEKVDPKNAAKQISRLDKEFPKG